MPRYGQAHGWRRGAGVRDDAYVDPYEEDIDSIVPRGNGSADPIAGRMVMDAEQRQLHTRGVQPGRSAVVGAYPSRGMTERDSLETGDRSSAGVVEMTSASTIHKRHMEDMYYNDESAFEVCSQAELLRGRDLADLQRRFAQAHVADDAAEVARESGAGGDDSNADDDADAGRGVVMDAIERQMHPEAFAHHFKLKVWDADAWMNTMFAAADTSATLPADDADDMDAELELYALQGYDADECAMLGAGGLPMLDTLVLNDASRIDYISSLYVLNSIRARRNLGLISNERDVERKLHEQKEVKGDVLVQMSRKVLDDAFNLDRAPIQKIFHRAMMSAVLPLFYRDDWGACRERVLKKNHIDRVVRDIIIST